jgi:hypothetical protein
MAIMPYFSMKCIAISPMLPPLTTTLAPAQGQAGRGVAFGFFSGRGGGGGRHSSAEDDCSGCGAGGLPAPRKCQPSRTCFQPRRPHAHQPCPSRPSARPPSRPPAGRGSAPAAAPGSPGRRAAWPPTRIGHRLDVLLQRVLLAAAVALQLLRRLDQHCALGLGPCSPGAAGQMSAGRGRACSRAAQAGAGTAVQCAAGRAGIGGGRGAGHPSQQRRAQGPSAACRGRGKGG